jgi:hypothetical protein
MNSCTGKPNATSRVPHTRITHVPVGDDDGMVVHSPRPSPRVLFLLASVLLAGVHSGSRCVRGPRSAG